MPTHMSMSPLSLAEAVPALYSDRELAGNCINECLHKCQRGEGEKMWGSEGKTGSIARVAEWFPIHQWSRFSLG